MTDETIASEELTWTPRARCVTAGNETQLAAATFMSVEITERTHFPFNIFKQISVLYIVDLVLPMDTPVEFGEMSDVFYTSEGYGLPVFKEIEHALAFIRNYRLK